MQGPVTVFSNCPCGIDVHAHVVPERFPSYMRTPTPADWPSMAEAQACHKHVMVSGRIYRTVSDQCWSAPKRLVDMDAMNVRLQALSPMPELLSTWMEAEPANDLLRYINDQIAEMVAVDGSRFVGLGAVPLQDVDRAIAELTRCVRDLGFAGVEIGSNVNGRPLGAPEFDPFFAAIEALGACVFVHAVRPAGMDRLIGPAALQQVLAYPTDVGLSAASIITTNLLVRRPKLRIAFSHGGGTLAALLPRLDEGYRAFPALQAQMTEAPSRQARRLYVDSLVYDEPILRHIVSIVGDDKVMLGSDYPFGFHERRPVARVEAAFADDEVRRRLFHLNAETFLGVAKDPT